MTDESESPNRDSSNRSSESSLLSGKKSRGSPRVNAAKKSSEGDPISDIAQKSGEKEPSGSESPNADGLSIPSSVDPDAPSSTDSSSDE